MTNEPLDGQHEGSEPKELPSNEHKFKAFVCGEEALKISPTEPYCLHRPIRRGHLNISEHYSMQQVQSRQLFAFYHTSKLKIIINI